MDGCDSHPDTASPSMTLQNTHKICPDSPARCVLLLFRKHPFPSGITRLCVNVHPGTQLVSDLSNNHVGALDALPVDPYASCDRLVGSRGLSEYFISHARDSELTTPLRVILLIVAYPFTNGIGGRRSLRPVRDTCWSAYFR
jgi:hypothetical protein